MKVKIINTSSNKLPAYETTGSAGMDLRANLKQAIHLQPRERVLIPTGLKIQLPEGYEAQVRPRSGLSLKEGIIVLNSPGTIDSDYTGEIGVIIVNHGKQAFIIQNGDRIAQLVFQKVEQVEFEVVDSLEETQRGEGGFGSTGVKEKDNSKIDCLSGETVLTKSKEILCSGKNEVKMTTNRFLKEVLNPMKNISLELYKIYLTSFISSGNIVALDSNNNILYFGTLLTFKDGQKEQDLRIYPETLSKFISQRPIPENYEDAANRFLQEMMDNGFHFDSQQQLDIIEIYYKHRKLEGTPFPIESAINTGADSEDNRYIYYSVNVLEILKQRGIKVPYAAFVEIKQLFYKLLNK